MFLTIWDPFGPIWTLLDHFRQKLIYNNPNLLSYIIKIKGQVIGRLGISSTVSFLLSRVEGGENGAAYSLWKDKIGLIDNHSPYY